jgi:lysophospholipase L1-like esterase
MRRWAIGAGVMLVLAAGACWATLRSMREASFWESEVEAFEAADRESFPTPGRILFTGSSSIRLWTTLAEDMAPLEVLNRGFGGSHVAHLNEFARRIAIPYRPRAIVVYSGDNDVASGKSAQTVARDFEAFVSLVHAELPGVRVYWMTIKPSPLRFRHWPEMRRANTLVAELARRDPLVRVIDVSTAMFDASAEPRGELYAIDRLHLNAAGYALWTSIVKPELEAELAGVSR